MYINQYDTTGECAKVGNSAEELFEKWLIKNERTYRKATLDEQYKHIDFIIYTPEAITVDVKGPKKVSRNGSINKDILWVEFKNVLGNAGWLYGENEFIAFYQPLDNSFYVVRTSDLALLCEQLCIGEAANSKDALYKRYTRMGRKDEISMIKFTDLTRIEYWRLI